jgi:hypothetical protein
LCVIAIHAAPVIAHAHKPSAAFLEVDINGGCTSVERIFEKFLHDGSRALDNFAGRDLVGDITGEHRYPRHVAPALAFIVKC